MFKSSLLSLTLIASSVFSINASACDDKACEAAYLAETKQHVDNHFRQATASKIERHAYSKNRERRAYAYYVHIHFMLYGAEPSKNI